ncbi:origin recognition complex subunit 4 [Irineochytrium annulatum]|nr:origin recognition complex subunit 4 [Irineochytrium annulatum]
MVSDAGTVAQIVRSLGPRLSGVEIPAKVVGLENEHAKLRDLLTATVVRRESNSAVLIGNHGAGKSLLIRSCLKKLREDGRTFIEIYLDGTVTTTDRLALREIACQLHLEDELERKAPGSVSDCFQFLLSTLNSGTRDSCPVIFILDSMDAFAHSAAKQNLLYTLFDLSQARANPISVIGLTTRVDVVDLLEKRIKSRFSHRIVYVGAARDFGQFVDVIRCNMCLTKLEEAVLLSMKRCLHSNIPSFNIEIINDAVMESIRSNEFINLSCTKGGVAKAFQTLRRREIVVDVEGGGGREAYSMVRLANE